MMIKMTNVSKAYKGTKLNTISNISFDISKEQVVGILGPSGAGKSTIFKILNMSLSRDSGSIEIIDHSFRVY